MTRSRGVCLWFGPLAALLVLSSFLAPVAVRAQDQDFATTESEPAQAGPAAEGADRGGADALQRLETALDEGRRYRDKMAAASTEDSLVLLLQLDQAGDRFLVGLGDVASFISGGDGNQEDAELRARALAASQAATGHLWELIGEMRVRIDQTRARRPDVPMAERSALEDELAQRGERLDRFYDAGWQHVRNLESWKLDTAAARGTLVGLVVDRADELSGRLALSAQRIRELVIKLKKSPGTADLNSLLAAAKKDLKNNTTSQGVMLTIMDAMRLPTDQKRAQLEEMTRTLASGMLDAEVTATLIRQAWQECKTWLTEHGPAFLIKVLLFLIIMAAGVFLARLVSRAVEKSLERTGLSMSHLLRRMIVIFTRNALIAVTLVLGLAALGLSLGPLLAGFGVVGFILGFAMQDSLSNLAAGMMILINRPYDVGDLVEISGAFGKVEQMSMVSTSVLTLDNQKLVVPNSKIWGDVIKNVTDQRVRRIDMTFGISYKDDIPHAERVLNDILAGSERVLDEPEPVVRLHKLGESSVDFVVRPWVKTDDYWEVYWEVTRAVKMRFDEESISIPFPQRDVHLSGDGKPA